MTTIIGYVVLGASAALILISIIDHLVQASHRRHHHIRRRIKAYSAR